MFGSPSKPWGWASRGSATSAKPLPLRIVAISLQPGQLFCWNYGAIDCRKRAVWESAAEHDQTLTGREEYTGFISLYCVIAIPPPCPYQPPSRLSFFFATSFLRAPLFLSYQPSFQPHSHFSFRVSLLTKPSWFIGAWGRPPPLVFHSTSPSFHFSIFFISLQKLYSSNLSIRWKYLILLHNKYFHFIFSTLHLGDTRRLETLCWPKPL